MKPYKILKRHEALALILFNIYSYFKVFFEFDSREFLKKNKKLNETKNNERCFVLMGGLSVREIDITKLYGCDVITANNYFRTDDYLKIRPKYHVITDADFFSDVDWVRHLEEKIQNFTSLILNIKHAKKINNDNWYYIYPAFRVVNSRLNLDLSKPCSNFSTVALTCIQLAIHLKYKEIYLVGFDLPPGNMPHYYSESKYDKRGELEFNSRNEEYEYCELFWQYTNCHHESYKINEYAKLNGIKIFNTSNISFVRAFQYKDFKEI